MKDIYHLQFIYTTQNKRENDPLELSAFSLPADKLPVNSNKPTVCL